MKLKDFFATDKVAHFGVSMFITILVSCFFAKSEWCVCIGAAVALAVGIGKEIYDKAKGGIFDGFDLWADMLGILCGVFTLMPFVTYIYELELMLGK